MMDCLFVIKFDGTNLNLVDLEETFGRVRAKGVIIDYLIDQTKGVIGIMRLPVEVHDDVIMEIRGFVARLNDLPNSNPTKGTTPLAKWARVSMQVALDQFTWIERVDPDGTVRPDFKQDDNPYKFEILELKGGIGAP